jgi:hypothetical protein
MYSRSRRAPSEALKILFSFQSLVSCDNDQPKLGQMGIASD